MVNVPGRSKGCATCRRRKIKCDQTFPQCVKCTRIGELCPGPRTEAFFVHTTASTENGQANSSRLITKRDTGQYLTLPDARTVQACRADAFDQLFLCHFIESFGDFKSNNGPDADWLALLPVIFRQSPDGLSKHAIRSTTMVTYGTWARDASIRSDAYQWYGKALASFSNLLSLKQTNRQLRLESAICSAVMMIHFETWANTTEKSWHQHVQGAASLLEEMGAKNCQVGFLHGVFRHLRMQVFIVAVECELRLLLASPEWMTVPFQHHPKEAFDELIDVLFSTQKNLKAADGLRQVADDTSYTTTRLELIDDVVETHHLLEQWRKRHHKTMALETVRSIVRQYDAPLPSDRQNVLGHQETWLVPAAALMALEDVATMINATLLQATGGGDIIEKDDPTQGWDILRASYFVRAVPGASKDMGPMMILPPLKIASIWSTDDNVRKLAQAELEHDPATKGALGSLAQQDAGFFAPLATHLRRSVL